MMDIYYENSKAFRPPIYLTSLGLTAACPLGGTGRG